MQPWVAISPVCSAYTGWWPWLVALPFSLVRPSCPHVGVENSVAWAVQLMALDLEVEVADKSVAWAVGALSAKVALVAIQARVGGRSPERLGGNSGSGGGRSPERLGGNSGSGGGRAPEGLVAMHPPLVQSPHPSSSGSMLPGTMLATLLAVALLITLAWLGQKKTYTNLT